MSHYHDIFMERVDNEVNRQLKKWGEQNHDVNFWVVIEAEEFGEVAKAAFDMQKAKTPEEEEKHYRELLEELVQVAAVARSMYDSLERNRAFVKARRDLDLEEQRVWQV